MTQQNEKKVVISQDDTKNVVEYFSHFNIQMPDYLKTAADQFDAEPTFANQQLFKLNLCKAMLESQHESFKDEMFDTVKENASKAMYDLQFDYDLRDELGVEKKTKD